MHDDTPFMRIGPYGVELRTIVAVLLVVFVGTAAAQGSFPWWAPVVATVLVISVELALRVPGSKAR